MHHAAYLIVLAFCLAGQCAVAADATPTVRIAKFAGDRAAAISYTFDDNLRDQYTLAVPMLNEVGFKGTFFVIPGATVETREEAEKKQNDKRAWGSICWPELQEMAAQGHEIGSHTWSHSNLQKLPHEELESQFSKACESIRTRIGRPPLTVAFPFNASTPEVQATALKHHLAYRAYQKSMGGKDTVTSLNEWADTLVKDNKWGVLMAHAIANGYAALSDAEILRAHLKHVKSREGDIWVDTFANIARYEKERDDAKLTVTGTAGHVTCVLSSSLDPQLYNMPLTIVIDANGVTPARAERAGKELLVRVEHRSIYFQAAPSEQPVMVTWKQL